MSRAEVLVVADLEQTSVGRDIRLDEVDPGVERLAHSGGPGWISWRIGPCLPRERGWSFCGKVRAFRPFASR